MIKFSVSLLNRQDIDLVGEEPPSFIGVEDSEITLFHAPVNYTLHATLNRRGILVTGDVSTDVDAQCGRCLKPFRLTVANHDICLFLEVPDAEECDISEEIRTELLIRLPINFLCDEECLGLCSRCGVDRNTTPCKCSDNPGDESPWTILDKL